MDWKDLDDRRQAALKQVERAGYERELADHRYEAAIFIAHELGLSNAKIAQKLGLSEVAIRSYIKRRKDKQRD